MHLLHSGVPLEVVALWLGHEQVATTHGYLEADLTMKRQIFSQLKPTPWRRTANRTSSNIIAFLEALQKAAFCAAAASVSDNLYLIQPFRFTLALRFPRRLFNPRCNVLSAKPWLLQNSTCRVRSPRTP